MMRPDQQRNLCARFEYLLDDALIGFAGVLSQRIERQHIAITPDCVRILPLALVRLGFCQLRPH